jgi:hypothetical protein
MSIKKYSMQHIATIATALTLAACGGNSSDSPPAATPTPLSGKAVDGYLAGSTVFCDINSNGTADTGEATTTTDANGNFIFAAGCTGTIVVFGGSDATTSYPFRGILEAPAGSTVVTPLTTLVAGTGLTIAQLATALSLPAGTDVTTLDPADGSNQALLRRTLAVQQLIQQLANTLGTLTGSSNIGALYSTAAQSLGAALLANSSTPLLSAEGSVNQTVWIAAVQGAVTATLANTSFTPFTISEVNLLAAAAQIASQAQSFLTVPDAELAELILTLQSPSLPAVETNASANYVSLQDDSVLINGSAVPLDSLASGATVSAPETVGIDLDVHGAPAITTAASVALQLVETGGQGRLFQLLIDKVNVTMTESGLSIAPGPDTRAFAYGHTESGTDINLAVTNPANLPLTVTDSLLTLDVGSLLNTILASTTAIGAPPAAIAGTFNLTVVVAGLPLRSADGQVSLAQTVVSVTGTGQSVTGVGVIGTLIIP